MVVFSKFTTIPTSCMEYCHPWTTSCTHAATTLTWDAAQESFRIYVTVYMLALIMRGKIPDLRDIKKTVLGVLQSTLFLTCNGGTFPLYICLCRSILGNYNALTVSFVPAVLAAFTAILLERPSRRGLLSLYVTNVASETLFRMAAWRGLVSPIRHGEVMIFAVSVAVLLYFYRGRHATRDSVYGLFRFVVGPFEEQGYAENREDLPSQRSIRSLQDSPVIERRSQETSTATSRYQTLKTAFHVYKSIIRYIKSFGRHPTCPHPFSCCFYVLQGSVRLFSLGYGLQVCVRILLQLKHIIRRPHILPRLFFHKNALKLGAFLGGFSGAFRLLSCLQRRMFNKDSKYYAIPAGLLAGLTFGFFPNTTIALYIMWKSLQVIYNDGIDKGILPELQSFTIILYCLSTALLFHAAILEPHNLRPSYYKFLHTISGGRISTMDRKTFGPFGLDTQRGLLETAQRTRTMIYSVDYFK